MPGEQAFAIEEDRSEGRRRVILRGNLDPSAIPQLQGAIVRLCEGRRATVVLDLRELGSIDSVGMHAVMAAYETMRERGHDVRVLPGARVRDVQELTTVLAGLPLLAPRGAREKDDRRSPAGPDRAP
ncbi:MAG TPA: STAS domain-containing protein [Solirubrobacteraceae bacterium]|nr:STAS domain-containing protein [Solirubrobacteraceae bacterium]